jgi:pyruvate-formate lyase-activating enzyme
MAASDLRELPVAPAEPWWERSLMVTLAFRCNLACRFCMVEDALGVYEGTSLDAFRAAAGEPGRLDGVERVVLSGGEVTLAPELVDYVRLARSLPGVKHVRLQTNATRLSDRAWLAALLEAGVDELFVSLHAARPETCDAITRRSGSLPSILAGMRAIADSGATLITNTCVVRPNVEELAGIVELASAYRPRSMEFWSYWPRAHDARRDDLLVPVGDALPHLVAALDACIARRVPPVVKWFPRCLLGPYAAYQDDGQPPAILDDRYWDREPDYACIYEGVCEHAGTRCSGLSVPYVERFGWEEERLRPSRARPAATGPNGESLLARSLVKDEAPRRADAARVASWLARFDVAPGAVIEGWTLASATRGPAGSHVALTLTRANETVEVRVLPREAARRAAAKTPSFDLVFAATRGARAHGATIVRVLADRISACDVGGLPLPG